MVLWGNINERKRVENQRRRLEGMWKCFTSCIFITTFSMDSRKCLKYSDKTYV